MQGNRKYASAIMNSRKPKFKNTIPSDPGSLSDQKFGLFKGMKTNVFIFSIIILSIGCSSRNHLKFQGVPINGDLTVFTEELIRMGYQAAQTEEEDKMKFTGKFLEKDCSIYLSATKESHTPYMIRVDLQEEPYDSLKISYERLKEYCASILGPGASKYQQFNNSARFLFNEPKLARDPKNGDFTRYLGRAGNVYLEVKFDYLSITYLDKKNSELSVVEGGKEINPENGKEY